MRIEDQLEALELIDLVSDCIEMDIPYICILDNKDREVILFLPEGQKAGTEYQKHTYSINAAQKIVQAFFSIEDFDETDTIDYYLINPNDN